MKTGEASKEEFTGCISNYDMVEIGEFDLRLSQSADCSIFGTSFGFACRRKTKHKTSLRRFSSHASQTVGLLLSFFMHPSNKKSILHPVFPSNLVLVEIGGFEPPTSPLRTARSSQLSYIPTMLC